MYLYLYVRSKRAMPEKGKMSVYFKILNEAILNHTFHFQGEEEQYIYLLLVCSFWKFRESFAPFELCIYCFIL